MRTLAVLLSGGLLALQAPAQAGSAGAEPFNFLFLDANARAVGLSGACTARASDVNALLYNPAGLAGVKKHQATFMHNQYFQDISQEYLGYASPYGWGASFNYLSYGDIPRTTVSNQAGAGLGSFGASDMALSAGYGRELRDGLAAGAAVKMVRESLDDVSATGFALDLGLLYSFPAVDGLSVGAALQNLGPKVKFDSAEESLPMNLRLGGAYSFEILGRQSSASLDLTRERSEDMLAAAGFEMAAAESFPVRLGYNTRNEDGPGITAGLGYINGDLSFDYAFAPFKELGAAHRLSVTLAWGGEKKKAAAPIRPVAARAAAPVVSTVPAAAAQPASGELQRLLKDLENASAEVRQKAVDALAEIRNGQAYEGLLEALADENDRVAGSAAKALGRTRNPKSLQPLLEALGDASSYLRASAAKGLGYLGDKRARAPLRKLLKDSNRSVKKAASDALKLLE